jgi:YEATS domain-containing protein 4
MRCRKANYVSFFLTIGFDKAPFQVTETGWGEFDVQIKILFVAESGEKPITTYHRLKLHPWHPIAIRAPEEQAVATASTDSMEGIVIEAPPDTTAEDAQEEDKAIDKEQEEALKVDDQQDDDKPNTSILAPAPSMDQMNTGNSLIKHPPVVHSWAYDEIVFPEPTEAFYEILLANPPTP